MATRDLTVVLDVSELQATTKELSANLEAKLAAAAQSLAVQAHAHVLEEAKSRLKTRQAMFSEALKIEQIDAHTWAVVVPQSVRWIEDGMPPHNMLSDLLNSPKAKVAKGGGKYLVVPFKHSKGPTQQTPVQKALTDALKAELKKRKIPYGRIEKNPDGSPKTGLLHSLNIAEPKQENRPSQGHQGPAGRHYQIHSPLPGHSGPGGRPYLWGVRIYQTQRKNPDGSPKMTSGGQPSISRDIMTFRVASSKQEGSGKWDHPGLAPMNFLDEAHRWVQRLWDEQVKPDIIRGLGLD